ncbi:alpha/beta-hydrolase family protein [Rarobacter faecitabidus]|uniref:Putative membrane protein n=1 Tax=Rarobacter faecitabidus TaxID=13243 RepID=A0A542ZUV4_RARFA|nr:alpha/beta-hydrolase family protein [Rarobacter faecitabidus]TQL64127.1 putative membrane protein [Rarobacter faecitabidus]
MRESTSPESEKSSGRIARWLNCLSTPGIVAAVLTGLWSFTPSLLARTWWVQGAVTAVTVISAYAVGCLLEWVVRSFDENDRLGSPRLRAVSRRIITGIAVVGLPIMIGLGIWWQSRQRDLLGMPPLGAWEAIGFVLSVVIVPVLFIPVLGFARLLRRASQSVGAFLRRMLPRRLANVLAALLVALLAFNLVNGVLITRIVRGLDESFQVAAGFFDPGSEPPESSLRSGSPGSLVPWDDLGREGRRFVTRGPSKDEIARFEQTRSGAGASTEAEDPIRVYAGLTESLESSANLIVGELDRTGAWDREAILIVATTGSGWVDEPLVSSFEFLHGGDSAVAAMQYSYLPSWMAFLGDRGTPPVASQQLFTAVAARLTEIPVAERPKLYVAGLSLGSYGMQSAFANLSDLRTRTDGAVFAGTPYFVPMWNDLTNSRDDGSTQVEPVVDGGQKVRFYTGEPGQLEGDWAFPRVAYLQHGTDGTTWWDPSLFYSEPAWMDEDPAPGVMDEVAWFPVTSFWQVAFDLFFAAGSDVPMGTGHHFQQEYVNAFAAVCDVPGWTAADTELLRAEIARRAVRQQN